MFFIGCLFVNVFFWGYVFIVIGLLLFMVNNLLCIQQQIVMELFGFFVLLMFMSFQNVWIIVFFDMYFINLIMVMVGLVIVMIVVLVFVVYVFVWVRVKFFCGIEVVFFLGFMLLVYFVILLLFYLFDFFKMMSNVFSLIFVYGVFGILFMMFVFMVFFWVLLIEFEEVVCIDGVGLLCMFLQILLLLV